MVYDKNDAYFHLEMAERCEIVEAIITKAQIAYGLFLSSSLVLLKMQGSVHFSFFSKNLSCVIFWWDEGSVYVWVKKVHFCD